MSYIAGPWSMRERYIEVLDSTVTLDVFAVTANRGEDTVCEIPMGDDSTAEANARLIAAAPDLLCAMQELFEQCVMVHRYGGDGCNQKEADAAIKAGFAAIAKATGGEVTQ